MMRAFLLWLSTRQSIFNFVRRNRLAKKFASRFVAGETIEDAVAAAKELQAGRSRRRSTCSAKASRSRPRPKQARDTYLAMLRAMQAAGVEVNVSVKLTQMGLDIDPDLCERNMRQILDLARQLDGFVRLDMEGSPYTQRDARLLRAAALCRLRRACRRRDSGGDAPLHRRHREPDPAPRPGPALQGRLPRESRGRLSRQEGRRRALRPLDGADAARRQLSRHRDARRNDHRARQGVCRRTPASPAIASNSRCSTACGATCRSASPARGTACGSTSHSARSGIPT